MLVTMGIGWDDFKPSNLLPTLAKVAVAPITLPWQISAELAKQGITQIRGIKGALQPTPPAGAGGDPAAALVIGSGPNPMGSGGGSTSNLPIIIGSLAAAGLLVTALLLRGKR